MSFASLHASAAAAVADLPTSTDPVELSLRQSITAYLNAQPMACARANVPGHITASTFVFDHTRSRVLLTLHPRLGRWVQLGGHCEPEDADVAAAATREAREESGIAELVVEPRALALRVFALTCSLGVPTRHIDLYFRAVAPAGAVIACSDESDDLKWWPIAEMPDSSGIRELARSVADFPASAADITPAPGNSISR